MFEKDFCKGCCFIVRLKRGDFLRVTIVDDEYYALEGLRIRLAELDGVELVGMYEDSEQFLEEVQLIQPDLVLLDIEMPKVNGFQVQERLKELGIPAQVIFVTAYSHYAEQIARTDAVGHLLKPVAREKLESAMEKALTATKRNVERKIK